MNLSFFFCFAAIILLQCFLGFSDAGVTCGHDGHCRDTKDNGEGTVCSNCFSCTFKNCCNKVYTIPNSKCKISGWKRPGYIGNWEVDIGAPRKRDVGCSRSNPCAKEGHRCVAYKKGDDKGFCWKGPQGEAGPPAFALAVAIAGLVILL